MNINVPDIATTLQDLGIPAERQGDYLKAALARVIAYRLPLPAAPEADAAAYYESNLASHAAQCLDVMNERLPLDYEGILTLTQALWQVRYSMLHPSGMGQGWALIDIAANAALKGSVDLTDPALQRLAQAITDGVED